MIEGSLIHKEESEIRRDTMWISTDMNQLGVGRFSPFFLSEIDMGHIEQIKYFKCLDLE